MEFMNYVAMAVGYIVLAALIVVALWLIHDLLWGLAHSVSHLRWRLRCTEIAASRDPVEAKRWADFQKNPHRRRLMLKSVWEEMWEYAGCRGWATQSRAYGNVGGVWYGAQNWVLPDNTKSKHYHVPEAWKNC